MVKGFLVGLLLLPAAAWGSTGPITAPRELRRPDVERFDRLQRAVQQTDQKNRLQMRGDDRDAQRILEPKRLPASDAGTAVQLPGLPRPASDRAIRTAA